MLDIADYETDDDQPLAPSYAAEARPYLRKIFAIINDPKIEGRARTAVDFYVPEHLRAFCEDYLDATNYRASFFTGQLTGKAYFTVAPKGE